MKIFTKLCDVLKIPETANDERFNSNSLRCKNMDHLKELLGEFGSNVVFEQDLKKKIGSILVANQKFFIRQII